MSIIKSLSIEEVATFSNSICGPVDSARRLEELGLLKIRRTDIHKGKEIAFFDLTPLGETLHQQNFQVKDATDGE